MTKKAEAWLNEKIEQQSEQSLFETPVFFSYDVYYKIEPCVEYAKKLLARPKPYNWGKKKMGKTNETNGNGTTDGNSTIEEELTAKIEVNENGNIENEDIEE
eukprot:352134_1